MIKQIDLILPPFDRGFHHITPIIRKALDPLPANALLNIFLKHTSAGICIMENSDPAVETDMEKAFNKLAPENQPFYEHVFEGPDDMPAHIKSSLTGVSLTVPIRDNMLGLGTWQGIFLAEFRNNYGPRKLYMTIHS